MKTMHNLYDTQHSVRRPEVDLDWRRKHPVGSIVRLAIYETEMGWIWKTYEVLHYFPYIVKCRDRRGFIRCFGNWEFQHRQKGKIDSQVTGMAERALIREE
jgi:hypothetical protein